MTESRREKRRKAKQLNVLTEAQVATGWFIILALAALVGTIYLGQASRISGVTPAAVSLLLVHLKKRELKLRTA